MITPEFQEILLAGTTKHGGNGLEVGPLYLVLHGGHFYVGRFSEVWFGLNLFVGSHNIQYDPPGTNSSLWQRVWRLTNETHIHVFETLARA